MSGSERARTPVAVEDADSYNCFWRMPFRKSARIEIVNQSEKQISLLYYNIDWIQKEKLPADTPYFYARYRQEYPVPADSCRASMTRALTGVTSWRSGPAPIPAAGYGEMTFPETTSPVLRPW